MRALIRRLDALLRRACGVFEFCDNENCLLRLQITQASHTLHLDSQVVETGEPVLAIHLWNKHIPPLPPAGPDLAWATRTRRLFIRSLRAVASQMRHDPSLDGVRAVGGATALFAPGKRAGGAHLMQRLGFKVMPYHRPLGCFGEFWENFYSWWIAWTFNTASLRQRRLIHLHRSEVWMPAEEFLSRYGTNEPEKKTAR